MKLKERILVIEVWDRSIISVKECDTVENGIKAANDLLENFLIQQCGMDEDDIEDVYRNQISGVCAATVDSLNAWCNIKGDWDAYVYTLSAPNT